MICAIPDFLPYRSATTMAAHWCVCRQLYGGWKCGQHPPPSVLNLCQRRHFPLTIHRGMLEWTPNQLLEIIMFTHTITCPHCNRSNTIDFTDYVVSSSSEERNMGAETQYDIEAEDLVCDKCGKSFDVNGSIFEYPEGAFNYESLEVTKR